MCAKESNLRKMAEQIIAQSPAMRFVAVIGLDGEILEGIMKKGKTSLESQKEEERFCRQVGQRRMMRGEFDETLGKVRYVHVERERVSQLVVYTRKFTVFMTVEPEMILDEKIRLVNMVKKMATESKTI